MKLYPTLIWSFTILAMVFLYFSLRSKSDQLVYSLIALGCWGAGFLINRFKPNSSEEEEKT